MPLLMRPDSTYVMRLLEQMRRELEGLHRKIDEIERLRYLEDIITLPSHEKPTGLEVRVGLSSELIENVKAALTGNRPRISVRPHRIGDKASLNASKREKFWNSFIRWASYPVPVFSELADATVGLGIGIVKASYVPWPVTERRRRRTETDRDYLDRQTGSKKKWGPPFGLVTVHPLSYFFRAGIGNKVSESVEHSWKSKLGVYGQFQIRSDEDLNAKAVPALSGQPEQFVRPLPAGTDTSTMALVTEYFNSDYYQIYVNSKLLYEEEDPGVNYFIATGRTSSSKDPDKFGQSVAEILRSNEPVINRTLTRMAEGAELIVRKRLTIELPEGSTEGAMLDESGNVTARTFKFEPDMMEALPPGAKTVDPFAGTEHVYEALPFLNLLMGIMAQHGVSPIFKGMPPGAAGSGYRDNSLYMMARAQFQYLLDSYQGCIAELITWLETLLVTKVKQEVYCYENSLSPSDIEDWPVTIEVEVKPMLPQNFIAEGSFYDRMHSQGHITRNRVREQGMGIEQPEEEETAVLLEQVQTALIPVLIQDVIGTVLRRVPQQEQEVTAPQSNGNFPRQGGPGGAQQVLTGEPGRGIGRELGGFSQQGLGRNPPAEPGSFPPGQEPPVV